MSSPFLAEIKIFAGNFAPTGWALCDGQLLPISQNTALFSLLGTFYGGDGKSTFALPDLQGNAVLSPGDGVGLSPRVIGETSGSSNVTLLVSEMPAHTHTLGAGTTLGTQTSPAGAVFATSGAVRGGGPPVYTSDPGPNPVPLMNSGALAAAGSSFPHENMPPYLSLTFIIALQGIYPARP